MKKIYTYYSDLFAEEFVERVKTSVHGSMYIFEELLDGLSSGVRRGGHSGGYWYNCLIKYENGRLKLSGEIKYIDAYSDSIIAKIEITLLGIILYAIIWPLYLYQYIRKKVKHLQSEEEQDLDNFMLKIMNCTIC